jgi:hypothetical protein
MESMPDIVQLTDDKADIEKHKQRSRADFIPERNSLRQQIQHHQKNAAKLHNIIHKSTLPPTQNPLFKTFSSFFYKKMKQNDD